MSEPLGSGAKSVGKVTVALSSSTTTLIARLALPPPLDVSNSITCALAPATRANDAKLFARYEQLADEEDRDPTLLRGLLETLFAQDFDMGRAEVIVVDNGSRDRKSVV